MSAVGRELLGERVYEYLADQLTARRLKIGTHLKAAEIASELGVSRTTVRKALARLVREGYVDLTEAGKPVVVASPDKRRKRRDRGFDFANQTENAYWAIFERLFQGHYQLGEDVPGRQLADELGVSLGTVRQALDWLSRDGLFVRLPRRGWKVVSLSRQDVEDAFRFRLLLEPEALRRAIPRFEPAALEQLTARCRDVLKAGKAMSEYERRRADYEFHHTIHQQGDSPILTNMLDPLIRKSMLIGVTQSVGHRISLQSFREHAAVLAAIKDRDEEAAVSSLTAHLERSLSVFLRKYRDTSPDQQST